MARVGDISKSEGDRTLPMVTFRLDDWKFGHPCTSPRFAVGLNCMGTKERYLDPPHHCQMHNMINGHVKFLFSIIVSINQGTDDNATNKELSQSKLTTALRRPAVFVQPHNATNRQAAIAPSSSHCVPHTITECQWKSSSWIAAG